MRQRIFLLVALSHCNKRNFCLLDWVSATKAISVCRPESLKQTKILFVALSHCDKGNIFISLSTTIQFSAISAFLGKTWMLLTSSNQQPQYRSHPDFVNQWLDCKKLGNLEFGNEWRNVDCRVASDFGCLLKLEGVGSVDNRPSTD